MLLNIKHQIDRQGAEVNMIKFTVQLYSMSTEIVVNNCFIIK